MAEDKLLKNAGALLMGAGGIAALTGGMQGLNEQDPGIVVLSVLLLIGYGVVGYLLMGRGARHFSIALPGAAVLVLATVFILRGTSSFFGGAELLHPAITLALALAGGALLTHAVETWTDRVDWPGRPASSIGTLLHVAAYAPIWNAFILIGILRADAALGVTILSLSIAAALACIVGGHAANRRGHPAVTLVGASVGFLACAAYLFQFMLGGGGARGAVYFGELNALVGLILTGLPIAAAAVAWVQMRAAEDDEATDGLES